MSFFSGLFKASDHPIGKSLNFGQYRVTILKLIAEGTLRPRARSRAPNRHPKVATVTCTSPGTPTTSACSMH